ncbi:unnamed protein product, partial [Durusdinium trenchii]
VHVPEEDAAPRNLLFPVQWMNQRHCPVKDGFSILCAVDEDCTCANSSHLRELVNVTVDGLACYACEPRRPPACTEAHDQGTPEECECGNSRTHVKHAATTVDGSPCFYCEPIGGGFGQPIILPLSGVLLLVIWHFGRKPVRGSLRLSRRQGDRSRAIRVQQEPLKFYEEVLLTIGDAFDFLVDAACELLGMAWQLLKKVDLLRQVPQHLTSEWYRKKLDLEEKENEQRGKKEAKASKLPKDLKECRRSEVREVAGQYLKTNVQQAVVKVPSNSNAGSGPKIKPSEVKEVVKVPSNSGRGPKTKLSQEGKVAQVTTGHIGLGGPKTKALQEVKVTRRNSCQAKVAEVKVSQVDKFEHKAETSIEGEKQPDLPKTPELQPSLLYKATLAVMKANALAAQVQSSTAEELEGSTDGSAPIDAVDDETVQTESEDYDLRRPAEAQAILSTAEKRAAALRLLDAQAMPMIEVRTFIAEPEELDQAPVMRRTVSDSDVVFYADLEK